MTAKYTNYEIKLKGEIAHLRGQIEGLTRWEDDPIWRVVLLEKLLKMENYTPKQISKILYQKEKI